MRTRKPNDFPREGEHNTVTTLSIQQLEQDRPQYNMAVDYTIGGSVEAEVHTTVEAEREYAINRGHRILNSAANDLDRNIQEAARKPLSVDFSLVREKAEAHLDRRSQDHDNELDQTP